jgi:WD40 repeat protein
MMQVSLQGHERAVSCLDIEHSGNRLISGSLDYTLRIFDFNGMKADLRSFRCVTRA